MIILKKDWENALTKRIKEETKNFKRKNEITPAWNQGQIKAKIKALNRLIISGLAIVERQIIS